MRRAVDVYERLKLRRTVINRAFLDVLGEGEWGRITVHVLEDVAYSYTAWVPMSELEGSGVDEGMAVSVRLRRGGPWRPKAREWVCDGLELE